MKINFLDHVAIRVSDLEKSVNWYETVLGLQVFRSNEHWGPYPVTVQAGSSGIALFPKTETDDLGYVKECMHIAFNVDRQSFREFQHTFEQNGIEFYFEDHHYFHSIYISDPDGYKIELTTEAIQP